MRGYWDPHVPDVDCGSNGGSCHRGRGGYDHAAVVLADGTIRCWGGNEYGQRDVPSYIGMPGREAVSVSAGSVPTMARLSDGVVDGIDVGYFLVAWGGC